MMKKLVLKDLGRNFPVARKLLFKNDVSLGKQTVQNSAYRVGSGIGDILRDLSYGITSTATAQSSYVDMKSEDFVFIFDALFEVAASTGQVIHRLESDGKWTPLNQRHAKSWMSRRFRKGFVELAITDKNQRLIDRISLLLWNSTKDGYWAANAKSLPIKKTSALVPEPMVFDTKSPDIDAVFTWVNAADPEWQNLLAQYKTIDSIDKDRFFQSDELRYAIRSVELYAPWVRNIIIFTNCSPPSWFRPSDRVRWVRHEDVIPPQYLPVFNSHSIETFLHEIPGISDNFLYLNDDFFLCGVVSPSDFFTPYGASVSRLEPYGAIPHLKQIAEKGEAAAWQASAINGARLIAAKYGRWPTRVHRHAPYAINKTTYQELLSEYEQEAITTRSARFRSVRDVSFTSFFYDHYALAERRAVERNENSMLVRDSNFKRFLRNKMWKGMRFFCINDGNGSFGKNEFEDFKRDFPPSIFPFKSHSEH